MKTALALGLSVLTAIPSLNAAAGPVTPTLTAAPSQKILRLHETDVLALRVLVQLDYMQKTRQIEFAKLGQGMVENNQLPSLELASLGAIGTIGLGMSGLATLILASSYKFPGTYQVTGSNPSAIIGEGQLFGTATVIVTPIQALKDAVPLVAAATTSSLFAGFVYKDNQLMDRPMDSKLGRRLMGFDSQLGGLITSNIDDLSTILGFTAQQKQELKDAVAENVAQQLAQLVPTKVMDADVGEGTVMAPAKTINIDILKIANQLKMVDEPAKQSLRDVAAVVLSTDAQAKAKAAAYSATNTRARLATMIQLNHLISEASAKSPQARQALATLALRTNLAISMLKAAQ